MGGRLRDRRGEKGLGWHQRAPEKGKSGSQSRAGAGAPTSAERPPFDRPQRRPVGQKADYRSRLGIPDTVICLRHPDPGSVRCSARALRIAAPVASHVAADLQPVLGRGRLLRVVSPRGVGAEGVDQVRLLEEDTAAEDR